MSRLFKPLMAVTIVASMVIAPATAMADNHKERTPEGADCVKIENFGATTLTASAANGLTVTLTNIDYDGSNELKGFDWTADGAATVHVKASGFITNSDGAANSGSYSQEISDDGKIHAISHVTFCGTTGDDDGGDPPVTLPCNDDTC